MELSNEQVKELNRSRIDESNRERAAEYQAKVEAARINGWSSFLLRHSGQSGLKYGIFYDCDANRNLLEGHTKSIGLLVDNASLERAFHQCKDRLAQFPEQEYVRRTNTAESHVMPQLKSFPEPDLVLPYTRETILGWSAQRLKQEMKSPAHVRALNTVLSQR